MGKGTDKLYITHSEWASEDTFSASAGSGVSRAKNSGETFKRLPFNFCALSLQPFTHPVCTASGTIFDLTSILPWLKKHGTNPVDGTPLDRSELIKLNFAKNDDGEYIDPVTSKPLTDNTHIVALKVSGNVFSYDTIEKLNIKAKNWKDLVTDEDFARKDIIILQDPQQLSSRNLSAFKYIQDGTSTLTEEQEQERNDPSNNLNLAAMGSSAKIIKAKEAVARARAQRAESGDPNKTLHNAKSVARVDSAQKNGKPTSSSMRPPSAPYNAAHYTTGEAAASFTSTGVAPSTSNARALLSEEEYMLKPRRVKEKGYARIQTTHGDLNVELQTEWAPRAVWNFVQLAKAGYYKGIAFHRNIRNFMIQGGDPTGTGRGGQSVWGKPFADEWGQSALTHNARGILSMANKGKNTNTSQFFITYRKAQHLDRKHTIFGKVIDNDPGGESEKTLARLENVRTVDDKPSEECNIEDIVIFVDPFEEFMKNKANKDALEREQQEIAEQGGTEDDNTTWTGKRLRENGTAPKDGTIGVGKYLDVSASDQPRDASQDEIIEDWGVPVEEPAPKKRKAGGFGNFDNW